MGVFESKILLERIGRAKAESARKDILALFDEFDRDRSGKIEGYEIGSLVESIAIYISELLTASVPMESHKDGSGSDLSGCSSCGSSCNPGEMASAAHNPAQWPPKIYKIRSWVLLTLDANRNGILTKEELLTNLPRLLGEVNHIVSPR